MALLLTFCLLSPTPQGTSAIPLKGQILKRFLRTRGASQNGRLVRWKVSSSIFSRKPWRARQGFALFIHKKIGLLVRQKDPGFQEIKRRGGQALIRGRVRKAPRRQKKSGAPRYYIDIQSLTRRRR